jgi:hypothetical protein
MKRVFFINQLNWFSLTLAICLKPFFTRICFKDSTPYFQSPSRIKWIGLVGIEWVSFLNTKGSLCAESFPLHFILSNKTFDNVLSKSFLFRKLVGENCLDSFGKKKLEAALIASNFKNFSGVSCVPLITHYFGASDYHVYLMPQDPYEYLLLQGLEEPNITIIGIQSVLTNFTRLVQMLYTGATSISVEIVQKCKSKLTVLPKSRSTNRPDTRNGTSFVNDYANYTFAFVPHKGLLYGSFFKKTYLYEADAQSYFYKENILTLFFNETDEVSKRYLRRFKIPNLNVKKLVSLSQVNRKFLKLFLESVSIEAVQMFRSLSNVHALLAIGKFWYSVLYYVNVLEKLPSLKIIYAHYDILVPPTFIFACHLKGIETISTQERFIQYTWFSHLSYDHYLIAGDKFKPLLEKRGYVIKEYHSVGLPRGSYIANIEKNLSTGRYDKYLAIKEQAKLVLCFGLSIQSDYYSGSYGEAGTSRQSAIHFLETMYKLSLDYVGLYFVVRFKSLDNLFNIISTALLSNIRAQPNIEIQENYKQFNSYTMAGLSDLIIGKHTSIMEECLAQNKQVIFYDSEEYLGSVDYIFSSINIIERTYLGLKHRISKIMEGDYLDEEELLEFRKGYLSADLDECGFSKIKKIILDVDRKNRV